MPRKGHVTKREVMPDPIYGDVVVTKLINNIMLDGKKGIAQAIVYGAFDLVTAFCLPCLINWLIVGISSPP